MDVRDQVEQMIVDAGGVMQLAAKADLPRQTIYNLKNGGWPSSKVAAKLGLAITYK